MTLPISVRKTYTDPPTRPLSDLEIAQAEIVRLRAEVEMLWAELLNVQYEALRRVERVGAKLGKPTKSVKKNVQSE